MPESRRRVVQGQSRSGSKSSQSGIASGSGSNPPQFESSLENAGRTSSSAVGAGSTHPGLDGHPDFEIIRELGEGGMGVVYLAPIASWTGRKS